MILATFAKVYKIIWLILSPPPPLKVILHVVAKKRQ